MQTDALQAQQLSAVRGIPSVLPVAEPSSSASPESHSSSVFGPAYFLEGQQKSTGESFPLYGADGSLRKDAEQSGEEKLADARAVKALESRDRQVQQEEEAKGEAVGGRGYIYQTGPDGKQYAIGTRPHAVEKEEDGSGNGSTKGSAARGVDGEELSREDQELVENLEARDAKVRNHESAHVMAAGGQASMPTYTYQTGPDGKNYAIGGSVNIATMTTGDSEQDARRANTAYRAAMATGEPSSQDMQTATRARAMETEASQREMDMALNAYERQGALSYAW